MKIIETGNKGKEMTSFVCTCGMLKGGAYNRLISLQIRLEIRDWSVVWQSLRHQVLHSLPWLSAPGYNHFTSPLSPLSFIPRLMINTGAAVHRYNPPALISWFKNVFVNINCALVDSLGFLRLSTQRLGLKHLYPGAAGTSQMVTNGGEEKVLMK